MRSLVNYAHFKTLHSYHRSLPPYLPPVLLQAPSLPPTSTLSAALSLGCQRTAQQAVHRHGNHRTMYCPVRTDQWARSLV